MLIKCIIKDVLKSFTFLVNSCKSIKEGLYIDEGDQKPKVKKPNFKELEKILKLMTESLEKI